MTGFEKTRLPHSQYQTYDFTRNGLLAQYTTIFHCWPCSKATGLVSVAAFLRSCVSLEWHFGAIGWSWLSCIGAWRAGQPTKGWPMSVIFNGRYPQLRHNLKNGGASMGSMKTLACNVERKRSLQRFKHGATR